MTNAELVALLREARKVALDAMRPASHISYTQWTPEMHRASIVLRDIDAAISAHDTPVEVEWKTAEYGNQYASIYDSANTTLRIAPHSGVKGKWAWDATVYGYADTEAEAKEKALKASRGEA